MQARRVEAGTRIDHVGRQGHLLRASGGIVGDVDRGRKRTHVAGKEEYVDDATLPSCQSSWAEAQDREVAPVGPTPGRHRHIADGERGSANVRHRHMTSLQAQQVNRSEVDAGWVERDDRAALSEVRRHGLRCIHGDGGAGRSRVRHVARPTAEREAGVRRRGEWHHGACVIEVA